jgi:hypothetical protein
MEAEELIKVLNERLVEMNRETKVSLESQEKFSLASSEQINLKLEELQKALYDLATDLQASIETLKSQERSEEETIEIAQ